MSYCYDSEIWKETLNERNSDYIGRIRKETKSQKCTQTNICDIMIVW